MNRFPRLIFLIKNRIVILLGAGVMGKMLVVVWYLLSH